MKNFLFKLLAQSAKLWLIIGLWCRLFELLLVFSE